MILSHSTSLLSRFIKSLQSLLALLCLAPALLAAPSNYVQKVTHNGETITMRLSRHDLRGAHFELWTQNASGSYDVVTPVAERSYIGSVDEYPGAVSCGILKDDGTFWGAVYFDRGVAWRTLGTRVTSTAGTAVGTVVGTEVDTNDSLSYSITGGNAAGHFAIDAGNGALTTTATAPDYEVATSHALTVTVTDGSGATDTATITVNINNVLGDVDTDSDGLDDTWETTHFGNLTTVDGTSDSDGDGQTDAQEYAAKTNLQDIAEKLEIVSLVKGASDSTLNWTSKEGVSYKIEYSYDLSTWNEVTTNQSGATGQMGYADTDSTRAAAARVFYRVVVE